MAEDQFFPNYKADPETLIGLASPKDRLASYILDCTLLLPIVQLLQAPFKKWILESFLYQEGAGVLSLQMVNLVIFILIFIIYYSVLIWYKGQTLGKMFFGVKIISYQGHLTFSASVLRSCFIFFSLLGLGIPFLALFSHVLRRPLHDRVADTLAISVKNPVGFPTKTEVGRSRWMTVGMLGVALFSFSIYVSILRSDDLLDVADFAESCDSELGVDSGNLESLLEAHLVKQIDNDCLASLVRDQMWKAGETPLGHFAMAVALQEAPEESESYARAICELNANHHLCDLNQWLSKNADGETQQVEALLKKMQNKRLYNFTRVLIAGQLLKQKRLKDMDAILSPVRRAGVLQPIVASLSFHSLLGQMKWDEAYWVYRTHNAVTDQTFLFFVQRELEDSQLSRTQQIQLLEFFYPRLKEQGTSRMPASTKDIPAEIQDIYGYLLGES